ncbi:MAG: tail fiber domain-containing protein [Methylococcales bacterium]
MADKDFVVKNGLRTIGNSFVANSSQVTSNTNLVISAGRGISANGGYGTAGDVLFTNGSAIYWGGTASLTTNVAAQYTWSNTQTFSNAITFSGNLIITTLSANASYGTAGQALVSGGAGSNAYWTTLAGVNTAAQYTFTNTISFSNSITFSNNIIVNNIYANASYGTAGYVLTSSGSAANAYWSSSVLNANNASYLGGVAAANYVNTSGAYTLSGNITHSAQTVFTGNVYISNTVYANGSVGTSGQFLTTSGGPGNSYWSTAVTSVSVTSGQISASYSGANPTLGLATVTGVAGSYTLSNITVDSYGRITSASSGSASGGVTSIANSSNVVVIAGTGTGPYTGAITLDLAAGGAGAATYGTGGVSSITLDAKGRVTSVGTATYLTAISGSGNVAYDSSRLGGTSSGSYALKSDTTYVGTTSIALNRSSGSQTLTGVSIDGNAGTVSSITSGQVTTALGYTPYNSTNPSGYITSASLSSYATQSYVTSQGYITSSSLPYYHSSTQVGTSYCYFDYNTNPGYANYIVQFGPYGSIYENAGTGTHTMYYTAGGSIIASMSSGTFALASGVQPKAYGYTTFQDISDARSKKNITALSPNTALSKIMAIKPREFEYIEPRKNMAPRTRGFIAQEFLEQYPYSVTPYTDPNVKEERLGIGFQMDIFADLVGSIQALKQQIDDLKTEFDAYKASHP